MSIKRPPTVTQLCERYPELVDAAYHEAGHLAAARLFGRQIIAKSIDAGPRTSAFVSYTLGSTTLPAFGRVSLSVVAARSLACVTLERSTAAPTYMGRPTIHVNRGRV